jgi:sugar phosphate isomerase/epimerase
MNTLSRAQIATCWMHAGPTRPFTWQNWSPWSLRSRVAELARAGFTGIGFFHEDLAFVLANEAEGADEGEKLAWIKALLDTHGITEVEVEFLTEWVHPADDPRHVGETENRRLIMAAAKALRARHIKAGNFGIPVPDKNALRSRFHRLCDEAAEAGTRIAFEILPPDPNSQTLEQTLDWMGDHPAGGLFLDTWHVNNMDGISYADIAALPKGKLIGVELDDGLAFDEEDKAVFSRPGMPGFLDLTVNCRRIPGEGDYDVVGFINACRAAGFDGPWGNEVLSEEFRRLPMQVAYRRVFRATAQQLRLAASVGVGETV